VAQDRGSDRFYSRRQPNAVERVPFSEQQQGMERVARRVSDEGRVGRSDAAAAGAASLVERAPAGGAGRVGETARVGEPATGRERVGEPGAGRGDMRARRVGEGAEASAEERGWRRFGEPAGGPASAEGAPVRRESRDGWRRFGEPPAANSLRPDGAAGQESAPVRRDVNDGWRRLGEGGGAVPRDESSRMRRSGAEPRTEAPAAGAEPSGTTRRESNSEWRRLGEGGTAPAEGRVSRGAGESRTADPGWRRFSEAPAARQERTDVDGGAGDGGGRTYRGGSRSEQRDQERIQLSPPVVRERAPREMRMDRAPQEMPRTDRGSMPSGGGRVSRGESAPRMQAPMSRGGDGGGGSRGGSRGGRTR
jgi:hypothetical protein